MIVIADPEIIQDMVVKKNAQIDKKPDFYHAMSNFLGESFVLAPTDEKWKAKRKGIAHTFFKSRLVIMLATLKEYTMEAQQRWLSEIKASQDGSTQINMSREILHILQRFLMHCIFGTNIDSTKLTI